jgi:V/A-type H+-transporting ATPase subunit D
MPRLNIAPTKSNLLLSKRQLAFAEEGYDLLEQKRQILILELMGRLNRAQKTERDSSDKLRPAFEALTQAELDTGSNAIDRSVFGMQQNRPVTLTQQRLMGLKLPRIKVQPVQPGLPSGLSGTSSNLDRATRLFTELLPILGELAELQTAITRLARELRKTQRRCNALSRTFIPDYRATITYIAAALEERERESFVILKMIRNRLAALHTGE